MTSSLVAAIFVMHIVANIARRLVERKSSVGQARQK